MDDVDNTFSVHLFFFLDVDCMFCNIDQLLNITFTLFQIIEVLKNTAITQAVQGHLLQKQLNTYLLFLKLFYAKIIQLFVSQLFSAFYPSSHQGNVCFPVRHTSKSHSKKRYFQFDFQSLIEMKVRLESYKCSIYLNNCFTLHIQTHR